MHVCCSMHCMVAHCCGPCLSATLCPTARRDKHRTLVHNGSRSVWAPDQSSAARRRLPSVPCMRSALCAGRGTEPGMLPSCTPARCVWRSKAEYGATSSTTGALEATLAESPAALGPQARCGASCACQNPSTPGHATGTGFTLRRVLAPMMRNRRCLTSASSPRVAVDCALPVYERYAESKLRALRSDRRP